MSFGYFPDFKGKSPLKDLYLKIFGYPYPSRKTEALMVFDMLKPKHGEKILDIGCGDGIFTNELAQKGYDVTGIDISNHDLSVARKRAKQMGLKVKYIKMDAQKMTFKKNTFDKIFSISTIEHIKNDKIILYKCFNSLKETGCIIISTPLNNDMWLASRLTYLPQKVKNSLFNSYISSSNNPQEYKKNLNLKFRHYRRYDLKTINKLFKNPGFKIKQIKYHITFFSKVAHSLLHIPKIFEWEKKPNNTYIVSPLGMVLLTILFPLLYPLYYFDIKMFPHFIGYHIVIKAKKL